jgi:uncharacterized membrane-anchored protein YitT (DUF2179 family)
LPRIKTPGGRRGIIALMAATRSDGEVMPTAGVQRHSWFDDVQGLVTGVLFVAVALMLLKTAGLMTGGTAGIAFVLHYATGTPFGWLFFVVNLPFYALAWQRLGARFTVKTIVAVSLLAWLSERMPSWLQLGHVEPWFAAVAGGLLLGAAFIILFRHRTSLGGLNVLVLWLQDRFGWRAGLVQGGIDLLILLAAVPWLDTQRAAWSVAGALVMNLALAVNHKPGRYAAL